MLDDRKLDVLRAIVEDYVSTHEPVGSKTLVERHRLGVSPATIRNDMAVLEDEGYIQQPHTSAGRVPTDKGYRLFVDRMSSVKPLSSPERRAIQRFLEGAVDLDDVIRRTVRLLAQITQQVAVVQYPRLSASSVRHVETVPVAAGRLLVVLITDTGRVEQRMVEVPVALSDDDVADLRARLNTLVVGRRLGDAAERMGGFVDDCPPDVRTAATAISAAVLDTLVEPGDDRLVLAGTANLTRSALDFPQTIRPILQALEEQIVLIRLFGELSDLSTVTVRIGEENPHEALRSTALVATGYGAGDEALAGLGVLGPTRMDYPGTISAVRAIARYVGQILSGA